MVARACVRACAAVRTRVGDGVVPPRRVQVVCLVLRDVARGHGRALFTFALAATVAAGLG